MITDGNGTFKGAQDHLPFGEDANTGTGQTEKPRFTNYERDAESGTDYAINRQHQYSSGRLMQPDPVDPDIADPQSLNRYAYVGNDAINLVDPLGLFWVWETQCYTTAIIIDGQRSEHHWCETRIRWIPEYDIFPRAPRFGNLGPGERGGGGQSGAPNRGTGPTNARPKKSFWDCYNKWKFSSLFENTPLHGAVEFLEVGLPDLSPHVPSPAGVSMAGDAVATAAKAAGTGLGGPKQAYASGLNWVFRRIFSGRTLGAALNLGDKATPALAVTGTFTGSYNATIAAQCLAGVLE
jgi:RHS repeat-associated protein